MTGSFAESLKKSSVSDRLFVCPLDCSAQCAVFSNPDLFTSHLLHKHRITILKAREVSLFLQSYIDKSYSIACASNRPFEGISLGDPSCPSDTALRRQLQAQKLESLLAVQQIERSTTHLQPRDCLFCPERMPNLPGLFAHMFQKHAFNIGLLDNLVEVDDFLSALSGCIARKECIYCNKIFPTNCMLKRHMKAKGHFKIHPMNHAYDRHYIVNFTEPGTAWNALDLSPEDEGPLSIDNSEDCQLVQGEGATCPFDDCGKARDAAWVWEHLREVHNFDLVGIIQELELGFYEGVKIVNYIRKASNEFQCFLCGVSHDPIAEHVNLQHPVISAAMIGAEGLRVKWDNEAYLIPQCEDDALLMDLDRICNGE